MPRALEVIETAIDEGDRQTALALLKIGGIGDVDLGRVCPTDPEVIADAEAREDARRQQERQEAEVRAGERANDLEMRRMLASV